MQLLAQRLRDTNRCAGGDHAFCSLQGPRRARAAQPRRGFGKDVGGGRILVRQKITQSDLAAMAGIARENVSRILQGLDARVV